MMILWLIYLVPPTNLSFYSLTMRQMGTWIMLNWPILESSIFVETVACVLKCWRRKICCHYPSLGSVMSTVFNSQPSSSCFKTHHMSFLYWHHAYFCQSASQIPWLQRFSLTGCTKNVLVSSDLVWVFIFGHPALLEYPNFQVFIGRFDIWVGWTVYIWMTWVL